MTQPSPRELEIVKYLANGYCYKRIAREMGVTPSGVRAQVGRTILTTGSKRVTGLVAKALREGWIT